MVNKSADISLRAQVLTLFYCTAVSDQFIAAATGYFISQIYRIRRIAKNRGFDSNVSLQILDKYVTHAAKTGRRIKASIEKENEIIEFVIKDRYVREKSSDEIAYDCGLGRTTVWRILKRRNYRKMKPSSKLGLTDDMRKTRLAFCFLYKDWTIEDWKRVIWSDETAVVLGHRRGALRI